MDDQNLGITDGSTFWRVIFILVESGMALFFFIQLARFVTSTGIIPTEAAEKTSMVIDYIHPMFNVNTSFLLIISLMTMALFRV